MVILTLGGGLGNQMFQYAFARKLQIVCGDDGIRLADYHLKNTVNRADMLFHLNVSDNCKPCDRTQEQMTENFQEPLLRRVSFLKKIARKCKVLRRLPGRYVCKLSDKGFFTTEETYLAQDYKGVTVCEDGSWQISERLRAEGNKFVEGNFQTWEYWRDMEPLLREELRVKTTPSEANQEWISRMQETESVCVHIRRGDYLAPEYAHLNVCDQSYYARAMESIRRQKADAVFYIFSNDHKELTWIQEHYDFSGYRVVYVDMDNPDYEELRLMYSCKHFIISNSTFSWWGQFLCDNPDKIVIAPDKWNRQCDATGIYMPEWQLIRV
ncbi:MAG: alpha-1,2-fucosyltransferase [Agathobacter sp.]|nr:alpha-1,2-fucosyltransferase [Agathobacter sp.]